MRLIALKIAVSNLSVAGLCGANRKTYQNAALSKMYSILAF